jgi:hypothetical protein
VPVGDPDERVAEIGLRVQAVERRRLDDRVYYGCPIPSAVGAGEEVVLAVMERFA